MSSIRFVKILILFVILILLSSPLFAQNKDYDSTSLLLLYNEISSSNLYELQQRAKFLNLEANKSSDELRQELFKYYNIEKELYFKDLKIEEELDEFEIIRADKLYKIGEPVNYIILEGNALINFKDEKELSLSGDKLVIDIVKNEISALGNIKYHDLLDSLEGQILTLSWQEGTFYLSDGYTTMVRDGQEEELEFYTMGSIFYYNPNQKTLLFKDSVVTTNKEQAYFSISSTNLFILEGGDFFATNAKLKMGHVPILYLPFFFYPAKTFVFNPAFGFDLERGWFFNSTIELYGRYPKVDHSQSVFSSLLKKDDSSEIYKDGWTYSDSPTTKNLKRLENWANSSNSYFAFFLDVYQNRGPFIAIDTKNNFFDNKLKIDGFASAAYNNQAANSLSNVYQIEPFRYSFKQSTTLNTSIIKLFSEIEYYSDVRYKRDYFNRLNAFNLDFLTEEETSISDYTSDITKLEWLFRLNLNVPTKKLAPYIKTLRINNLNARVLLNALKQSEGSGYIIDQILLPDLSATVAGSLINLRSQTTSKSTDVIRTSTFDEIGLLNVEPLFEPALKTTSKPKTNYSYLNLDYTVNQIYKNDTKDLSKDEKKNQQYYRLNFPFVLKAALNDSIIKFEQKINPLFVLNSELKEKERQFNINLTTDISSNLLGLSYGLTNQLYNLNIKEDLNSSTTVENILKWDEKSVTRHFVSFKLPFKLKNLDVESSVTSTLKPLKLKITPALAFSYSLYSLKGSYSFLENESGYLEGDSLNIRTTYLDPKSVDVVFDLTYKEKINSVILDHQFRLNTFFPYFKFSDSFSYDFSNRSFEQFQIKASIPWASLEVQGRGAIEKLQIDLLEATINVDNLQKKWWKDRIFLSLTSELSYRHHFFDNFQSLFSFKFSTFFSIAEFLDLNIGLTTVNSSLHQYDNFKEMFKDLLNSFDFFGDGRKRSQFTMESVEIGLIHYMADWTLHCKYQASVVLSDLRWQWQPVFTIYLQWKAFEQIKVERDFNL
jgi:lipopolysaccharide assembly outer membrane protein LptD (OstA)